MKLITALLLFTSTQASAVEKLICGDRGMDSFVLDITAANKLEPGQSCETFLNFKAFRSFTENRGAMKCHKPVVQEKIPCMPMD